MIWDFKQIESVSGSTLYVFNIHTSSVKLLSTHPSQILLACLLWHIPWWTLLSIWVFVQQRWFPFSLSVELCSYRADAITSHLRSDGMPVINFTGVMIRNMSKCYDHIDQTSVGICILGFEWCVWELVLPWSLARNPDDGQIEWFPREGREENVKKSLTRRSSNVVSLVLNEESVSDKGTALFIAATLLQKRTGRDVGALASCRVLNILYSCVRSNSMVSDWNDAIGGKECRLHWYWFCVETWCLRYRDYAETNISRIRRRKVRDCEKIGLHGRAHCRSHWFDKISVPTMLV